MARIRTLKPEFWSDEKLGPLPPKHRLVFLGLISMADDEGRLVDSVRQIDGLIFPHTNDTTEDSLEVLSGLRRILRYTSSSGQSLIQIVNWSNHQRVDKPAKYTLPGPQPQDFIQQQLTESSREPTDTLATSSRPDLRPTTYDHGPTTNDPRPVSTDQWPVKPRKVDGQYEYPDEFEAAWKSYPTRRGSNPKVGAYKSFRARVKSGDLPEELILSADHYRKFCQHDELDGTEFVKQAATFWGPQEAWREFLVMPTLNGKRKRFGNGVPSDSEAAQWDAEAVKAREARLMARSHAAREIQRLNVAAGSK